MKKVKFSKPYILKWLILLLLIVYAFFLLFPLLWALLTSVKSYEEYAIFENVIGVPTGDIFATLAENYKQAWELGYIIVSQKGELLAYDILSQFFHSLMYAGVGAIFSTLSPCFVSYVVARYPYKFLKVIYGIVVVTMVIPVIGNSASYIQVWSALGIHNTWVGIFFMKSGWLGMYFLVFYAQFKMISKEYTEAARIDGASEFSLMMRVIMPLAKGTIATIYILLFVASWNDYQGPMLYLPSRPTLALGMYEFIQRAGPVSASVPMRISYMSVVILPVVVVFLFAHDKIMGNLTIGGIKG